MKNAAITEGPAAPRPSTSPHFCAYEKKNKTFVYASARRTELKDVPSESGAGSSLWCFRYFLLPEHECVQPRPAGTSALRGPCVLSRSSTDVQFPVGDFSQLSKHMSSPFLSSLFSFPFLPFSILSFSFPSFPFLYFLSFSFSFHLISFPFPILSCPTFPFLSLSLSLSFSFPILFYPILSFLSIFFPFLPFPIISFPFLLCTFFLFLPFSSLSFPFPNLSFPCFTPLPFLFFFLSFPYQLQKVRKIITGRYTTLT